MDAITYVAAQQFIEDGDILFFKGTTLISKIISFFTSSEYTHVAVAFWATINNTPRLMVAEIQGGTKRRIMTLSYYSNRKFDVVKAPVEWSTYVDVALAKIGQVKYGWLEAGYVGLREFLFKRFQWKLPGTNLHGEICSEYVASLLNLADVHISPQKLFDELKGTGHTVQMRIG